MQRATNAYIYGGLVMIRMPSSLRVCSWSTESELARFSELYVANGGHPVGQEYLARAAVYVVMRGDVPVGGVAVNTSGPLRVLEDMPPSQAQDILAQFPDDSAYEITCLWIDDGHRSGRMAIPIWLHLCFKMFVNPRPNMLACSISARTLRLYSLFHPREVYRGALPGTATTKIVLAFSERWRILPVFPRLAAQRAAKLTLRSLGFSSARTGQAKRL